MKIDIEDDFYKSLFDYLKSSLIFNNKWDLDVEDIESICEIVVLYNKRFFSI